LELCVLQKAVNQSTLTGRRPNVYNTVDGKWGSIDRKTYIFGGQPVGWMIDNVE
jgi:hypothetical protein